MARGRRPDAQPLLDELRESAAEVVHLRAELARVKRELREARAALRQSARLGAEAEAPSHDL